MIPILLWHEIKLNTSLQSFLASQKLNDMISLIDYVNLLNDKSPNYISEHIRVSELCIKGNAIANANIWTVKMFIALEEFFNNFNAKYLVLFFMSGTDRVKLTNVGIYLIPVIKTKMN